MDREFIARHWYASIYEQLENQTDDVEFLVNLIAKQTDGAPQNILEAACGGGRILIPLARAGHRVTGFDADEHMLLNCCRLTKDLPNARCHRANAVDSDWGEGYDIVVLGGNVLINIEWTDMDYAKAQRLLLSKAVGALRPGGHLYLDFDLHSDPAPFFNSLRESSYFSGYDDLGNFGRTVGYGGVYDPVTRIATGCGHIEITLNNGERIIQPTRWSKHIPSQAQVYDWLTGEGLIIERTYMNRTDDPIPEPVLEYCNASLWARKV